jgi:transposase-like protein
MNPPELFCPNPGCPASGKRGLGNIRPHAQAKPRWRCSVCKQTFTPSHGTVFYRKHTSAPLITTVLTLVAYGCPVPAISAAFNLQARTVHHWIDQAGQHCEQAQQQLVEQPRPLQQVQADEIRVKTQRGVMWMAMAMVVSTRLWLGGRVSAQRDRKLIGNLAQLIARCAAAGMLLVAVDGLVTYLKCIAMALRQPQRDGKRGRPRLAARAALIIGQVVKQRVARRLVGVERRVAHGDAAQLEAQLVSSQAGGVLNTSYIERLNGTFRARLAVLARRTRNLARQQTRLQRAMYLVGTVYNFCTIHQSLSRGGRKQTPAMAAGISAQCWDVKELLNYRIAPPAWRKRGRGKPSSQLQEMLTRLAALSHLSAHLPLYRSHGNNCCINGH